MFPKRLEPRMSEGERAEVLELRELHESLNRDIAELNAKSNVTEDNENRTAIIGELEAKLREAGQIARRVAEIERRVEQRTRKF